ncbi:hypothetical protein [Algoriphagus antarcticus]|uniref:hypothetical protein n=1 Tax=Algoriphagus antarcticus TaxID=238540 RepID=UPI0014729A50|nr:hypothetical protein [Algoriphagus antarcticus]
MTKENSLTGRKAYMQNEITAVLFVQLFPYDGIGLHKKFKDAVYGKYQPAESK